MFSSGGEVFCLKRGKEKGGALFTHFLGPVWVNSNTAICGGILQRPGLVDLKRGFKGGLEAPNFGAPGPQGVWRPPFGEDPSRGV